MNSVRFLGGDDQAGKRALSVIDEDLHGVLVQYNPELQLSAAVPGIEGAGRGHIPAVARIGPVKGERPLTRPVGNRRMETVIFRQTDLERFIISRLQLHSQIQHSSGNPLQPTFSVHVKSHMLRFLASVFFQLTDRVLINPAVADGKLPGNGHHAVPLITLGKHIVVPGFHPGDHDSSAVLGQHRLGRVKIQSVVHGLHPFPVKLLLLPVIRSRQKHGSISVVELQAFCLHILRRDHQHLLIVQREEIRTLPHFPVPVAAPVNHGLKLPLREIFGGIQKNLAAAVCVAASHHHIIGAVLFPYLWIPEILQAASLGKHIGGNHRIAGIFFIIRAVAHCQTLCLTYRLLSVRKAYLRNACVQETLFALILHRTAGKYPLGVIGLIRRHRRRQIFPADQILSYRMAPVHGIPCGSVRIILVKQMVYSLISGKSVGIVHPSRRDGEVTAGTLRHVNLFPFFLFLRSGLFQIFANHVLFLSLLGLPACGL